MNRLTWVVMLAVGCGLGTYTVGAEEPAEPEPFKGHPAVDGKTLVFVARKRYEGDHHNTATMFQTGEVNTQKFTGGGAIRTLEVDTGKVTTLLELPDGLARDLEVSFDGKRLLFSMRENIDDDYHIYEMDLTKKAPADAPKRGFQTPYALRQITFGSGISDIDPIYSPEKRFWTQQAWQGSGMQAPGMAYNDFNNKRILGTVPVEEDGSAYFAVPADRFVYFQLLDENKMMVQSMRSGTITRPGETNGCVGCHESRRLTGLDLEEQKFKSTRNQRVYVS